MSLLSCQANCEKKLKIFVEMENAATRVEKIRGEEPPLVV
jgi:hypothetical protein